MDNTDSSQGLYTLDDRTIYLEAKELFQAFFTEQTPLNAFKLSIILYHLSEWIVPDSNNCKVLRDINNLAKEKGLSLNSKQKLVLDVQNYELYEVLKSIANTSKHYYLSRTPAYEQSVVEGFRAGQSVAGEKLGQTNLAVIFHSKEVWLREVFAHVLSKYAEYFDDPEGIYPTEI